MDRFENVLEIVPRARVYSLLEEFKKFAFKGNVVDLAVGVIIGAAFGKIVDSLVKNILMPLVAIVLPGNKGYLGWSATIRGSTIHYGQFLGEVVNFLIVAVALFLITAKLLQWTTKKKAEAPPAGPTKEEVLLTEIRDAIRANTSGAAS